MNKCFYLKLAITNIRRNAKTYIPFILTSIFTAAMFYVIMSLSLNDGLHELYGGVTVVSTLALGTWIVAIFAVIFLFYTNSFLVKRRKREFGLFNILGMEKQHLARVLAWETCMILIVTLVFGLLSALLLDKLMFLLVLRLLRADVPLGFYISTPALITTVVLFTSVFFVIFLNSLRQIHLAKLIELLHSDQAGEKEPKSKWFMALIGFLCLGSGYYLAITTTNPVTSILIFFLAVILVIIGTYLLFTSCSIVFLKMLRKNKRYYYKTNHFTSVSGMIYRMKQNAVGLGNICILITMVLVMVSSTTSMVIGMDDMLNNRYIYDYMIYTIDEDTELDVAAYTRAKAEAEHMTISEDVDYQYLQFAGVRQNNTIVTNRDTAGVNPLDVVNIFAITLDEYNREANTTNVLHDNEILLYINRGSYDYETLNVFDRNYQIVERPDYFVGNGMIAANVADTLFVVVKDDAELRYLFEQQDAAYRGDASSIRSAYGFNVDEDMETQKQFAQSLNLALEKDVVSDSTSLMVLESRAAEYDTFVSMYVGFFFIGIFLGTLFVMATILIIYYKQISEGYDDKRRFEIMQNVGMSHLEVKRSIRSQILTVFFLPLITAGVHVAFAFPIISRILALLQLTNVSLFIWCTIGCFVIFALAYSAIYALTARSYYRIVSEN